MEKFYNHLGTSLNLETDLNEWLKRATGYTMNPIRRKMVSVLSEVACDQIKSLSPRSPLANEVDQIEDISAVIADEALRMCKAATLGEITRIFLLINRLKRVNENGKEKITDQLNSITRKLIKRVESKTGPLKLSKVCLELFSEF